MFSLVCSTLALLELANRVTEPSRRADIFADIKSSPPTVQRLSRTCLLILGEGYRLLQDRGVPKPTAAPTVPANPPSPFNRSAVKHENIFRTAPRPSAFDRLTGTSANPPPRAAQATAQQARPPASPVPDVFRSAKPSQPPPPARPAPPPTSSSPRLIIMKKLASVWPRGFEMKAASRIALYLPDPQMSRWASESKSLLSENVVCALNKTYQSYHGWFARHSRKIDTVSYSKNSLASLRRLSRTSMP